MTTGKAAAAPKKAAAAKAEVNGGVKSVEWRGIKLEMPSVLSSAFALDMAEIEHEGSPGLGELYRLMVTLLGKDQYRTVRDKIALDGDPADQLEEVLTGDGGLLPTLLEPYGLTPGESSASAAS